MFQPRGFGFEFFNESRDFRGGPRVIKPFGKGSVALGTLAQQPDLVVEGTLNGHT
jgi:hypothetical protein